jgi:hypothetical protein
MMPDFGGLDSRRARRQASEYSTEQHFGRAERAERHIIATPKRTRNLLCAAQISLEKFKAAGTQPQKTSRFRDFSIFPHRQGTSPIVLIAIVLSREARSNEGRRRVQSGRRSVSNQEAAMSVILCR